MASVSQSSGLWLSAALLVGSFIPAQAATITRGVVDGTPVISITGDSLPGDAKAFATIVAAAPPDPRTIVDLSGPGGMVADGMRIGMIVHKLGWTTRVGDGHACYSTCAFIWIGGRRRLMSSNAHVAFHAPFDRHTYLVTESGRKMMAIYAEAVEINPATVTFIMAKRPGEGFDWLDADKAKTLGVAVEIVPAVKRQAGHFSTAAVDRVEGAEADERDGGGDAVMKDISACYAGYRRQRGDDRGFQCFALEAAAIVMAGKRAKEAHRSVDRRFTVAAAGHRLAASLVATGHSARGARALLQRWQADLHATASR